MSNRGRGPRGRKNYPNYIRGGNSDGDHAGNRGGAPDDRNSRESGGHNQGREGGYSHNRGRDNDQSHGRGDGHNRGRDNGQSGGHDDLGNKGHNGAPRDCNRTDITCNTSFEDIVSSVRPVLVEMIANKGYISFNVEIVQPEGSYQGGHRRQSHSQNDMVALLEATVLSVNPDAYISFYQPQYLILVQIVRSTAYISVNTADKKSYTQQDIAPADKQDATTRKKTVQV